ncbi:MAG: hypothetical protein HY006_02115 [Candidatus Sungbacteria bacterium]|nr:hypothetical protein [Candidatus Sungbacteria bacterium]
MGVLRGLRLRQNSDIERISRGLYRHTGSKHKGDVAEQKNYREEKGDGEKIFYQPFADYLVNGEECTKAKVLGGNRLGLRWSTPDVLGINKSEEFDAVKHWIEIVSAEIKLQTDSQSLITAFGQACAYRLFSHKVYIVVPETSSFQDIDRIESLCLIFGIGLILFNPQNPDVGTFNRKVWAMKHEPDFSYVNDESIGKIIRDIIRG